MSVSGKRMIYIIAVVILSLALDLLIYLYPGWFNHNSEYKWLVLWHGRRWAGLWVFFVWSAIVSLSYFLWRGFSKRLSQRVLTLFSASIIFLLGVLSPVIFTQIERYASYELLIRVMVSDHTGYFTDALRFKNQQELNQAYLENLGSLQTHSRTHPPGTVLIFMGLNRISAGSRMVQGFYQGLVKWSVREELREHFQVGVSEQAGAMLALILMLICAAISSVLGYFLVRRFYSSESAFISSLALVSIPAFSHKSPVMDQVFAMIILAATLIALRGSSRRSAGAFLAWFCSGLIIGFGLWLSPGVFSALILIPLLMLAESGTRDKVLRIKGILKKFVIAELIILAGVLLALYLGSMLIGANWLDIFRANRVGWHFNNSVSGRFDVWRWILFNPYEFFFFASLPVLMGLMLKLGLELGKLRSGGNIDYFLVFSGIFLLILDFSGQVCYESPRLCWFCFPIVSALAIEGLLSSMKKLHIFMIVVFLSLLTLHTTIVRLIY